MELARRYLEDLQDMLCDEVAHDWEQDTRFKTKREMQQYNCECFNNVYAIRKTLDNNQMEDNQTESTTNNTDLSENQEQNSDTPQKNLDKESDENEK